MLNKSPPKTSKKSAFINEMLKFADDDTYGYSQKPPNGRWGPDYDCSSLIYQAADNAGYPVGTGGDKVRFTGTMLKDFEKAGFQILPFANVGISDLEIGDILLNLALHAEVYIGEGQTVAATGSETGTYVGEAGDQTGREIERHPVITFTKDWDYVLRPPQENEDLDEEIEEGDKKVPMNQPYNPMNQPWQGMNNMYPNQSGYQPVNTMVYRAWNPMHGYPQGTLGQMNGYSQANAGYSQGGYPQANNPQGYSQGNTFIGPQGMNGNLCFVKGIEGAKNNRGIPNTREALFDEDEALMYIVSYDQNGSVNEIHVCQFEECSEEYPQHLSPLMQRSPMGNSQMQQGNSLNRDEIVQIVKEILGNESAQTPNQSSQTRGSQSRNSGNRSNN